MLNSPYSIGIYEKAMPASYSWPERLSTAKEAGFDFIEMSIDESDWRLERLDWNSEKRKQLQKAVLDSGIQVTSMCLSAHRRFPLGSVDPKIRQHSLEILKKAIDLALDTDIKFILVPGYDVFYEESNSGTEERFLEGLFQAAEMAKQSKIMLALENTDKYVTSISKAKQIIDKLDTNWFQLYGDIGNLVAQGYNVFDELSAGVGNLAGIHIKDAKPGLMRKVPLGEGDVPFEDFFQKLPEIDFQGPLMLELWEDSNQNPQQRLTKARNWIQKRIDNSLSPVTN
jgi:L-ribulose-5-phosphate 3-epimerase